MVFRDWMVNTKIIQSGGRTGGEWGPPPPLLLLYPGSEIWQAWGPGWSGNKGDRAISSLYLLHLLWEAMHHLKGYHDFARKETKVLRANCALQDWLRDVGSALLPLRTRMIS